MRRLIIAAGVAATLCGSALSVADENLYRYRNHSGELVIDHRIPPEFVAGGYEVLSRSGRVIEVIPPHKVLSEDEQQTAMLSTEEAEEQKKEDALLLRSYSTLEELQDARDRRLELLDRELLIVESNLDKSREQLADSQVRAANHQRSGRVVPKVLLDNISDLTEQIRDAEQMTAARAEERQQVSDKYSRYIERFRQLKGLSDDSSGEKSRPSKLAIDPASAQLGDD
jgi:hypothetical protein